MFKQSSGFTLIELLVVIAIIGVLSSIVLSSLNTARNKGMDAAAKSNLDGARAQAELFYDSNSNRYVITPGGTTDICSATGSVGNPAVKGIYAAVKAAQQAAGISDANLVLTMFGSAGTGGFGKVTCHACYAGQGQTDCGSEQRWAAEVPLKTQGTNAMYCVDSDGNAIVTTVRTLGAGDTHCAI